MAFGMYESRPATNGIRAEPPIHAEPIPAIDTLNIKANGAIIQPTPTLSAIWLTPCTIPCRTLMSFFPIATNNVSVAPIYNVSEMKLPQTTTWEEHRSQLQL